MNDRLLSLLGLARRAGKIVIGCDPVRESVDTRKAFLVLGASDISQNTEKKVLASLQNSYGIEYITLNRTKDELSFALGKTCAVLAVIDNGFAKKLGELSQAEQKEGGNTI